jgi:hypothetical protein
MMTTPIFEKTTILEIREYRNARITRINNGETPKPLDGNNQSPKIIFHLVPIKAFAPSMNFDLSELYKDLNSIKPIYSSVLNGQYNFDGFYTYGRSVNEETQKSTGSYVQIFHNGIIEAVDLRLLHEGYLDGSLFRDNLTEAILKFLSCQQKISVETPIFAMLSLIKVKGFHLTVNSYTSQSHAFEKDDLLFPEILINDFQPDPGKALKPLFDMVWHASGLPESLMTSVGK